MPHRYGLPKPWNYKLVKKVERVQRRATKYILNAPFICDIDYKDRLLATRMLPLSYWHEYLDMIFFYQANYGIFTVDKKILPTPKQESQRQTRSSDLNSYRYSNTEI